jgi:hypothetical protein
MDYITISTTSNATDFGDMSIASSGWSGTSNTTNERGVFMGTMNGVGYGDTYNTIEYITINSIGNSTDFGDLTAARGAGAATSNA